MRFLLLVWLGKPQPHPVILHNLKTVGMNARGVAAVVSRSSLETLYRPNLYVTGICVDEFQLRVRTSVLSLVTTGLYASFEQMEIYYSIPRNINRLQSKLLVGNWSL